jgi:hypothetical protein
VAIERFDSTHSDGAGNVWSLSGWYTYNDATGVIERLDWDNTFPFDILVTISQPGKADFSTVIRANRDGFRGNVSNAGYVHNLATYQVGRAP